jgi:malate dehydrogenase (oxaloacetate-decarboxylating)(NADP+)
MASFTPTPYHILRDRSTNKQTAFTHEERQKLKLRGLLPWAVETIERQTERAYAQFSSFTRPIDKYVFLNSLFSRNQTLFYNLVLAHIPEMVPIVYTPTVGEGCLKFASEFRSTAGMYLTPYDKGSIRTILDNWPHSPVDLIVVTDGGRILGLGDLGTNGMGIPIGKLHLYVIAAGFNPDRTLPVMLDVGTNNTQLLHDPLYLGVQKPRLGDPEYFGLCAEFMAAVEDKWPGCLVQFEDFPTPRCFQLLDRFFKKQLCFNDDIQGTGAIILAGVINAVRVSGTPLNAHRFLFLGAGSAATGVGEMIASWMAAELQVPVEKARQSIAMFDVDGLVTASRTPMPDHLRPFARAEAESKDFVATISCFKPTALIGLSGAGRLFTQAVVEEVSRLNSRPIVFALSNPTSKAECTAEDAYNWSDGKAIFAAGSPFDPVSYKGSTLVPGQGNNMFVFPGLGLGAVLAQARLVTESMIMRCAHVVADSVSADDIKLGRIFPQISAIKDISRRVAAAVMDQAALEGVAMLKPWPVNTLDFVLAHQWKPEYPYFV